MESHEDSLTDTKEKFLKKSQKDSRKTSLAKQNPEGIAEVILHWISRRIPANMLEEVPGYTPKRFSGEINEGMSEEIERKISKEILKGYPWKNP